MNCVMKIGRSSGCPNTKVMPSRKSRKGCCGEAAARGGSAMPASKSTAQADSAAERGSTANPADQRTPEGWPGRERAGARELNPPIGHRQRIGFDECRHERRRSNAIDDGAAGADETEQREERQDEAAE